MSFGAFLRRYGGFLGRWRGAPAVLLGSVPSHAAYFSTYEAAKEALGANRPGHHPVAAALTGALATSVHDGIATPTDVVKQRLQLGYYRGMAHCVRSMVAEEGLASLWRSYPTTLVANMPYAAVLVAANESFKKLLMPVTGPLSVSTYLLSGACAGALAAAATCPLDVVKTRLQTQGVAGAGGAGPGAGAAGPLAAAALPLAAGGAGGSGTTSAGGASLRAVPGKAAAAVHGLVSSAGVGVGRLAGGSLGAGHSHGLVASAQFAPLFTQPNSRLPPLGAVEVARALLREEGFAAFFKGVRARVAIHAPSQAISWSTYELVKGYLSKRQG